MARRDLPGADRSDRRGDRPVSVGTDRRRRGSVAADIRFLGWGALIIATCCAGRWNLPGHRRQDPPESSGNPGHPVSARRRRRLPGFRPRGFHAGLEPRSRRAARIGPGPSCRGRVALLGQSRSAACRGRRRRRCGPRRREIWRSSIRGRSSSISATALPETRRNTWPIW